MEENKPKKRGRKPKKPSSDPKPKKIPKKRGRKPKGGKIIKKKELDKKENAKITMPNIILHLKTSTKELNNVKINDNIFDSFTFDKVTQLPYKNLNTATPTKSTYTHNDDDSDDL